MQRDFNTATITTNMSKYCHRSKKKEKKEYRFFLRGKFKGNIKYIQTCGEIVWLNDGVVQGVGALQLQPACTGAPHWSNMNLQQQHE